MHSFDDSAAPELKEALVLPVTRPRAEVLTLLPRTFCTPKRIHRDSVFDSGQFDDTQGTSILKLSRSKKLSELVADGSPQLLRQSLKQLEHSLLEKSPPRPQLAQPVTSEEEELLLELPVLRWCPSCSREVAAHTTYVNTNKTFWSSVGIFLMGGVLGCFLMPYCMRSCKGRKQVCKRCQKRIS